MVQGSSERDIAFAVDAPDDDFFLAFPIRFMTVLIQNGFQRNAFEYVADPVGDGFPDGTCFADMLAWAVVRFVAEADDETYAIVEKVDHFSQTDFTERLAQPDAAVCADDGFSDTVLLEDGMDAFDGFLADIGLFRKGGDRNGCVDQMQLENDADGVSGIGGQSHGWCEGHSFRMTMESDGKIPHFADFTMFALLRMNERFLKWC